MPLTTHPANNKGGAHGAAFVVRRVLPRIRKNVYLVIHFAPIVPGGGSKAMLPAGNLDSATSRRMTKKHIYGKEPGVILRVAKRSRRIFFLFSDLPESNS